MFLIWNFYVVFLFNIFDIANGEIATICESQTKSLNCSTGKIKVWRAFYGRSRRSACSFEEDWFVFCERDVTNSIKQRCDNQKICQLDIGATDIDVREVCPSVKKKYLEVVYSCNETETGSTKVNTKIDEKLPIENETLCERYYGEIICPVNHLLNILSVFWGRKSPNFCQTNFQKAGSTNCISSDFLFQIKRHCDGERICSIYPHVDWLGDPCPDSSKYFTVTFQCTPRVKPPTDGPTTTNMTTVKPPTTTNMTTASPFKQVQVCENLNKFLSCPGKIIDIESATYGRTDTTTCNKYDIVFNNTDCLNNATKFVKFYCQDKQFCSVFSNSGELGDPCPGVIKYLSIKYRCVVKDVTVATTVRIPSVPIATSGAPEVKKSCGISSLPSTRVIDGQYAEQGRWPWQVAIYRPDGIFLCGGSIVDPMWIVTAAHCFMRSTDCYVVVGDTDRSKVEGSERHHTVDKVIKHDAFDKPYRHANDIALIKLKYPIIFDNYVAPVCLPSKADSSSFNNDGYITGWGKHEFPGYFSIRLRQAQMRLVSDAQCKTKLKTAPGKPGDEVDANMICATSDKTSMGCQGDSGGPFVQMNAAKSWVLRGIISWGSSRCVNTDMYLVMTRVENFITWIANAMTS